MVITDLTCFLQRRLQGYAGTYGENKHDRMKVVKLFWCRKQGNMPNREYLIEMTLHNLCRLRELDQCTYLVVVVKPALGSSRGHTALHVLETHGRRPDD